MKIGKLSKNHLSIQILCFSSELISGIWNVDRVFLDVGIYF